MRTVIVCGLLAAILVGCASGTVTPLSEATVEGPKIVALDAPRAPWVVEIESRLRKEGFKVLRWASTSRVREQTSETKSEEFRRSEARYVLVVDGYAPLDPMNRCFGGGYRFSSLTAELVDTRNNETVVSVSGSGYSEGCPPLSGTIFADVTKAVVSAWK